MSALTDDTLPVPSRGIRDEMIVFAVMAGLLALVPWTGIYPFFVMQALCFALLACAFNLLIGYGGLLSFGHAMFLGTAGYVSAHALKVWGVTIDLLHGRTMDVHVRRIRKKLGDAAVFLKTVQTVGFQWDEAAVPAREAQAPADKLEPKAVDPLSERFDKLHRTILPQQGELNWLSVPWLTSITLGQHQAAVQNKPLFIFADTGAGFADALGLC